MPATDRTQDGGASRSAQADEASDSEPAYSSRAELIDPERCPEPGPRPSRVTNLDGDDRKRYGEVADRGPSNPRAYWYADMAADFAGPGWVRLRKCIALGHSDEMQHVAHSTVIGIDPREPGVVV